MRSAVQDSVSTSGLRCSKRWRRFCSSLFRFACLFFAVSLFVVLRAGAEEEFTSVKSYDGNFVVTAPDATTAGWVAKLAEVTRERLFDLLGHSSEWRRAAKIHLFARTTKTDDGEVQLWTISVARGGVRITDSDVYPDKRGDAIVLEVVGLCLEDMARSNPVEREPSRRADVPLWLSCGLAENLSRENASALWGYARDIVRKERFLPFEELFRIQSLVSDEAQRELFFKESGTVVGFLLHEKEGASKLRRAVMGLYAERGFTASLTASFGGDFDSVSELQERWRKFAVEQPDRTIDASKMVLSETKEALASVLIVNIPTIDMESLEEKVVTTDFMGLFNHRNKRLARQIAREKASEIFHLRLRAKPEYVPVLEEYLTALTAIVKNERREFRRYFSHAETLRRKLEASPSFEVEKSEDVNTDNK